MVIKLIINYFYYTTFVAKKPYILTFPSNYAKLIKYLLTPMQDRGKKGQRQIIKIRFYNGKERKNNESKVICWWPFLRHNR